MAPKKGRRSSKKAARGIHQDEEWVRPISSEVEMNSLLVHGVLPNRVMMGWRPVAGEDFPTPRTDELVVFEDYFFRGFGVPIYPFLHQLIAYYSISLCNLGPNSILHVTIFINLCELYLGICPHFDLFHHFFCLKFKGGIGSRVVAGAYL